MLSQYLLSLGFINSMADSSLFVLQQDSALVYVLVYVDDILVTGSNTSLITTIIQKLSTSFALKDLGPLHVLFFGHKGYLYSYWTSSFSVQICP